MMCIPFSLDTSTALSSLFNGMMNTLVNGKIVMNIPPAISHPMFSFDVPLVAKYADADETEEATANFD